MLKWFSRTTIIFGLFIIISASFARQLMAFIESHIGRAGFISLIGLILISSGLAFFIFTIRNNHDLMRRLAVFLLLLIAIILIGKIKIPAERIHILEYGILGCLAGRDVLRRQAGPGGLILACLFCAFIGLIDESYQAILPYRFFDLRDIAFNSLGGIWGIALYISGVVFPPDKFPIKT